MKIVLDRLKANMWEHYKSGLFYMYLQKFEQHKLINEIEFLVLSQKLIYTQDVEAYTWNGVVRDL